MSRSSRHPSSIVRADDLRTCLHQIGDAVSRALDDVGEMHRDWLLDAAFRRRRATNANEIAACPFRGEGSSAYSIDLRSSFAWSG